MKIIINNHRKIFAIQEEFNTIFPYLRLEIFAKPNKIVCETAKKMLKSINQTVGECRTIHNNQKFTIIPTMTVADLERCFCDTYGIGVAVKRRSGKVWLEVTFSDGWTLEEQNRQGEALSTNAYRSVESRAS